MISGCNSRIR
ncbi:hypothetical protein YPPY94_2810, partial [Yersinia pestis PY-94]